VFSKQPEKKNLNLGEGPMMLTEKELTEKFPERQFFGQLVNQDEDLYTLNAAKKKKKNEDDDDDIDDEEKDDFYEEEEEENPFDVEPSEDDLIEDFPDEDDDLFDDDEDTFH
jgi:hypothetical protein